VCRSREDDAQPVEEKLESGSAKPTAEVHHNHNGRKLQELPRPEYGVTTEPRTQPNHYQAASDDNNANANDNDNVNAADDGDGGDDDVQTRDGYVNVDEKVDRIPSTDDDDDDDDDDQTRGDYMNVNESVNKTAGDYINVFEDGSYPYSTGTI